VAGEVVLARAVRDLVTQSLPEVADELRGWPDSDFLEPRLFAYFSQTSVSNVSIPQILYGNIVAHGRPTEFALETDDTGVVCVPRIGWFRTRLPNHGVILCYDAREDAFMVVSGVTSIPFDLVPRFTFAGSDAELVRLPDPLLASLLSQACGATSIAQFEEQPERYAPTIANALSIIRASRPHFAATLAAAIRSVVLFDHDTAESFAALGAQGVIFLNVRKQGSLPFFLDNFTHQGGHVIFSAVTVQRSAFFIVDPDTPLSVFGLSTDRSLYEAFHGLYTEHVVADVLRATDEQRLVPTEDAVELTARLALAVSRYQQDLRLLAPISHQVFTECGLQMFTYFLRACDSLLACRPDLLSYDLSGQWAQELDFDQFQRNN
jgi:hypothetical protein